MEVLVLTSSCSAYKPHRQLSNKIAASPVPFFSFPVSFHFEERAQPSLRSSCQSPSGLSTSLSSRRGFSLPRGSFNSIKCKAVGKESPDALDRTIYQGAYGPWTVESSDVLEVVLYRTGLVSAAASFVVASLSAFLPDVSVFKNTIAGNLDLFYATGAGGLGLSLFLIHIYVAPIKRFLQFLWALGVIGSIGTYLALAQPSNEGLTDYVVNNPEAVWLIGPLFASLTGLVFKEGLCYGKLEAGLMTLVIPSLLLGHLSSLMSDEIKLGFLGLWMALFVVFAGRKFTQPIKDDIGDKSVFMFNALPDEEKQALLQSLEKPEEM